jgi:large subunit ribosomal protein L7/L12
LLSAAQLSIRKQTTLESKLSKSSFYKDFYNLWYLILKIKINKYMKFEQFLNDLEGASVLELNDLVKAIEEKFGVSAQAVAAAPAAGGAAAGADEGKSAYSVVLADAGAQKIAVMKVVKEALGLGLKEAKDLVDAAPKEIKANVPKEEADKLKKELEAAGAKVELK